MAKPIIGGVFPSAVTSPESAGSRAASEEAEVNDLAHQALYELESLSLMLIRESDRQGEDGNDFCFLVRATAGRLLSLWPVFAAGLDGSDGHGGVDELHGKIYGRAIPRVEGGAA